jgi:hypothetical protein
MPGPSLYVAHEELDAFDAILAAAAPDMIGSVAET